MVKYYITFLRLTIVSTVIRYRQFGKFGRRCVCVGGGLKFFMNHEWANTWKFQSFDIAKNSTPELDGNRSIKGKLSVF